MVEYCGGELGVLPYPQHGKPAGVRVVTGGGKMFNGLPSQFKAARLDVKPRRPRGTRDTPPSTWQVGRYHSLYSVKAKQPKDLIITAETDDGVVMAVEHTKLPMAAVQARRCVCGPVRIVLITSHVDGVRAVPSGVDPQS